MTTSATIRPLGDAAVLIEYGTHVDLVHNASAHRLAGHLEQALGNDARFGRPVAGIASVLVPFDVSLVGPRAARRLVATIVESSDDKATLDAHPKDLAAPIELVVRYGGDDGPDLAAVATRAGISTDEVIALHAAAPYRVLAVGFVPGFAYLGPLPDRLRLPRRAEPRTSVPAGSVAIAGEMTAVYPLETPGGWHVIGRTSAPLWQPERDPPAMLAAGQSVRFRPATP
jgi:inhibitor of KinA